MNYIREMNSFYDWLETNSLSDSAINLWHALMHINNRAGWITEFTVAISTLENKTGLKKDAITRARLRLQQSNRIDFRSRSGQQSAIYSIHSFESHKTTQNSEIEVSDVLNDTNRITNRSQSAPQTASQSASIIKLNDIELNDTKKESSNRNSSKNVFGVYEQEIGPLTNIITEKLIDLELTYSEEWTKKAIGVAVFAGEKSMRYIEGILRKWPKLNHLEPWTVEQQTTKQQSNYNRGSPGKAPSGKPILQIIADAVPSEPMSAARKELALANAKLLDGDITQDQYNAILEELEAANATAT